MNALADINRLGWALLALVAVVPLAAGSAYAQDDDGATTLYVATDGNDAWSGRLPEANAEGSDGPLATIARARDAIRQLRVDGELPGPVMVRIRGGTYHVPETLAFGPEDSGSEDAPIRYEAYPGEAPVLSGGQPITGLQPAAGKVLSVELPEVKKGNWYFRQLFAGGRRQVRARHPNFTPKDPWRSGFLYVAPDPSGFGFTVGNIHNAGDWMRYEVTVPAGGEYDVWVRYGAQNEPFGSTDMGGRTVMIVDDGEPTPLMNLPDTGGWGIFRWSRCARLQLAEGKHTLTWQNVKGGGLDLETFALSSDPAWVPEGIDLAPPAEGKHTIIVQAEGFVAYQGKQLSVSGHGSGSKTQFHYGPDEVKPSWAEAPGAEIHIFQSGSCRAFKEIVGIAKVDPDKRQITVSGKECLTVLRPGDRYFAENIAEELDSPGEWYLDAENGILSFWPPEDLDEAAVIVAPALGRLVQFVSEDAGGPPVSHITLSGLTIQETDYSPDDDCAGYGTGNDGAVYLGNASHCAIEDCTFTNTGKYAVCIRGGGHNAVIGSDIGQSAEGGVLLLSTVSNTVSDNHVHDCGMVYKHIGGVVLEGKGTDDNTIAHNLIHHMSRYGITLKNAGSRNMIEYNRVHHTNLETYDTGGIEVTQQDREFRSGSVIHHNIVGDTIGYSSIREKPVYVSWGIYLDSFAGGYEVRDNIVYRTNNGGIMLQGGKDNTVINNVFVDGSTYQGYISNFASNSTGLVLERNIFAWSAPEANVFATGALSDDVIRVARNLYHFPIDSGALTRWGRGISFEQWQNKGFDTESRIADPLFTDPAKDDYSLRANSPAFELGFKPIDTSQIGPRDPIRPPPHGKRP